jgi:hypothetical protein
MNDFTSPTVLIVDFPGACSLRDQLLPTGARVHVVSPAAALLWAQAKKIDAAFISVEDASSRLRDQLATLGVRQVFVSPDKTMLEDTVRAASLEPTS